MADRPRNDTAAAIGGFIAILFVASAAFPWATTDGGADVYASVWVPIGGAILLGLFGAYWLAYLDRARAMSVFLFAAAVGCLGIAMLHVVSSRGLAGAGGDDGVGAGAVLGVIAAVAAVALSGALV
ncbi:MAG: hypothetical protein WD058_00530, partial [Dehalococcoidia bacterium]